MQLLPIVRPPGMPALTAPVPPQAPVLLPSGTGVAIQGANLSMQGLFGGGMESFANSGTAGTPPPSADAGGSSTLAHAALARPERLALFEGSLVFTTLGLEVGVA